MSHLCEGAPGHDGAMTAARGDDHHDRGLRGGRETRKNEEEPWRHPYGVTTEGGRTVVKKQRTVLRPFMRGAAIGFGVLLVVTCFITGPVPSILAVLFIAAVIGHRRDPGSGGGRSSEAAEEDEEGLVRVRGDLTDLVGVDFGSAGKKLRPQPGVTA